MAVEEAQRCLNCKNKPCMTGCPVQVKIPEFIALVAEGKFLEAAAKIRRPPHCPLSAAVSAAGEPVRVPLCTRHQGEAVAIGRLERCSRLRARKQHRKRQ